jgi:purine-binding chemotaxis protein CheW
MNTRALLDAVENRLVRIKNNGRSVGLEGRLILLCRVGSCMCALPLEHVEETMRPLPVEAIAGVPSYVLGLSIIRGAPVPVVDTAGLISAERARPSRFVTIRAGRRHVALAVDAVLGIRPLPAESLAELPPLLGPDRADVIAALASLDARLLLVLEATRIVPESLWETLAERASAR